jgi:hypothetical protein
MYSTSCGNWQRPEKHWVTRKVAQRYVLLMARRNGWAGALPLRGAVSVLEGNIGREEVACQQ